MLEAGWPQAAVFDAITVCSLFSFFNCWVDGNGVAPLSEEGYRESGRHLARGGYGGEGPSDPAPEAIPVEKPRSG